MATLRKRNGNTNTESSLDLQWQLANCARVSFDADHPTADVASVMLRYGDLFLTQLRRALVHHSHCLHHLHHLHHFYQAARAQRQKCSE
jgi:hypothetical protein